jgi:serine/threonine protein kinase/Tol biopolymer transport system component
LVLTSGTRVGVYEITALIGEGGMGQVYRARDLKLHRDVALKVLPDAFATDADRLARFTREAQTLASLNHPNIAQVHGLEESGGVRALVMELVEGEDLSQRIARGAVPPHEALPVAKQIAEALEVAHEQGIIHRDLKPANIKVRSDGTVKVLDFGLAKALANTAASATAEPTITTPAMTQAGMILGTAAYMSPEQARGKTVDKRADIWAFGCVLHEMLTGTRLFAADSVPETLGLIFSRELDPATLPAATPARIRTLIARCLVKDPRQRLRDIGEARLALDAPHDLPGALQPAPLHGRWRAVPWGIAAALAIIAVWALWSRSSPATTAPQVAHLEIAYPRNVENFPGTSLPPAISPDGRTVAMVGVRDGVRRIFVRRFDRAEAVELPGTAGANGAVFSPDGRSVAVLFTSGLITRITLADYQPTVVTSGADITLSIAWSDAGIIYGRGGALWLVSPDGGTPRALTSLDADRSEVAHDSPVLLPGGRRVLFATQTTGPGAERIESVSIDGGPRSVVVERARTPVWSPSGHLLFARDGAVLAVPVDQHTGTVRGTATPIMPAGAIEPLASGQMGLALSSSGTLLFAPAGFTDTRVVSVGRDGAALALDLPSGRYANPRISPDGRRLLVESGENIEALDLARGTWSRLAAATLSTVFSTWSADGKRVVFRRFASPFWVASDGSRVTGAVRGGIVSDFPTSPGPDPDSFVALRIRPETSGDVFLMSITGAFEPKPLIVTPAYEGGAQLSPDGHWLLYQSDASGRPEIYLRQYPSLDRQWQVSDGGGIQPRWSRNSREIYYRSGRRLVAVTLDSSGAEPVFGSPVALFADEYDFGAGASIANYDVTTDGRFIMIRRGVNGGKLRLVVNWTDELKQLLASGGVR